MLVRNHLLCPYGDCVAHDRSGELRIQVLVSDERLVNLKKTAKGKRGKTSLPYKGTREVVRGQLCPYCRKPVEVIIDETHVTRYVYLRQPK
jgi:hypothetical protein